MLNNCKSPKIIVFFCSHILFIIVIQWLIFFKVAFNGIIEKIKPTFSGQAWLYLGQVRLAGCYLFPASSSLSSLALCGRNRQFEVLYNLDASLNDDREMERRRFNRTQVVATLQQQASETITTASHRASKSVFPTGQSRRAGAYALNRVPSTCAATHAQWPRTYAAPIWVNGVRNSLLLCPRFQSGKPSQIAYIECFNDSLRCELRDVYLFCSLIHVRQRVDTRPRHPMAPSDQTLNFMPRIEFKIAA